MSPTPAPPLPRAPRLRRAVVVLALAAVVWARPAPPSEAGERGWRPEQERALNEERTKAIRRGCDWIALRKNDGGSFGDNKVIVATTALSALALMAGGSSYGRGPHGKEVQQAIDWLVGLVEKRETGWPEGFFVTGQDSTSRMHGQGYAILALSSALGSVAKEEDAARIRAVLVKAVRCAEGSQTGTGGWGYLPAADTEHEGSVTVTVAQGLRAANYAGVKVSRDVVVRGLDYLRKSQKRYERGSPFWKEDGSFKYSVSTEQSTYALTAAALSSFYLFGEYGSRPEDKDRIERGIAYLKRTLRDQMKRRQWHFYGTFYAAWTAWQRDGDRAEPDAGESWGEDPYSDDILRTDRFWGPWHSKVYPDLLRHQRQDGSWEDRDDNYKFGDLLPTAFAVLTLAIPDELIPVFQR